MLHLRCLQICLLFCLLVSLPAHAQARALVVFGNVGRAFPLVNLGSDGDKLGSGMSLGGGLGLQLGKGTALRAMMAATESNYSGPSNELANPNIKRSYYAADLMFGAPSDIGLAPYFFFGGGRMSIDPSESGIDTASNIAARLGAGINYIPDNSFFVLFLETCGWAYQFDLLGFDKLQFDATVSGGLAFAVPF